MVDTHCHIIDEAFQADREEVLSRARAVGMQWMIQPACEFRECSPTWTIAQQYPDLIYPSYGLHPENVGDSYQAELDEMHAFLLDHRPVAIGEVGMDLHEDKSHRREQQAAFLQQIQWALDLDLPLILHIRQAWDDTFEVMQEFRGELRLRGVFHCFSGSREIAERIQREYPGFLFGIGGVLTFKNATLPQVLREAVPLERIVLETDAPYMAPVPHRGQRNESAFIPEIIRKLAEVYETTPENVEKVTDFSAKSLFIEKKSKKK